jgi:hypothetical protein
MNINFFKSKCQEPSKTDKLFGICDDQNGTVAYTDNQDKKKWIATVINDFKLAVTFIAIDNCSVIHKPKTNDKESTCDGMLIFSNGLYLVELKDQGVGGWISTAKSQLENTIRLLNENHDIVGVRYKKAFACNKKHPSFTVIEASEKKAFFQRTNGFRIDAQAVISIKG